MEILKFIGKEAFLREGVPVLFEEEDDRANHHFAIVSNGKNSFKLAWHSEIEPKVVQLKKDEYAIGIDQNFVVVDLERGIERLKIKLTYNFYDVKVFEHFILVISELEITKYSLEALEMMVEFSLPDYYDGLEVINGKIVVRCINNEWLDID